MSTGPTGTTTSTTSTATSASTATGTGTAPSSSAGPSASPPVTGQPSQAAAPAPPSSAELEQALWKLFAFDAAIRESHLEFLIGAPTMQATELSEGADEASRALEEAGELLREAIHSKRWKDPTVLSAARKSRQRLQRAAKDLSSGALKTGKLAEMIVTTRLGEHNGRWVMAHPVKKD